MSEMSFDLSQNDDKGREIQWWTVSNATLYSPNQANPHSNTITKLDLRPSHPGSHEMSSQSFFFPSLRLIRRHFEHIIQIAGDLHSIQCVHSDENIVSGFQYSS